jgi:hypothetical protein
MICVQNNNELNIMLTPMDPMIAVVSRFSLWSGYIQICVQINICAPTVLEISMVVLQEVAA